MDKSTVVDTWVEEVYEFGQFSGGFSGKVKENIEKRYGTLGAMELQDKLHSLEPEEIDSLLR